MPASPAKKTATTAASTKGRALAQGAKEPSARAQKRAQATAKAPSTRQAPQEASAYTASTWGTINQFELTCPSGQKCLAHELPIERLVEMGLLEMVNGLSGIVEFEVLPQAQGQRPPSVDMQKLLTGGNVNSLMKVMVLVNTIVQEAVDAPELWPVPAEGEPRVNGRIYVDSVSMTDRFHIFSEVTGNLEGLASFREGA